ncbi:Substrate-specific component BioY of biotin ECF transporter [Caenispirillum salinarum AK4]|uniref:Biotin transporter n=1 Tax=Caenispirillum salinarum AK4 TaxID=1238182 RepID=K9GRY7_9PROT|nr:biotin transporter BioY [Caenispirillum salinarum]EKV27519.1 Substrate-specific component BioY of biotin ECF transporter [Caenispirillum salinarum AK4]
MMHSGSSVPTLPLARTLFPARVHPAAQAAVLVGLGVLVLTLSAWVRVPFWPVPMTLQTLAVLLLASAYGARLGTGTVLAYLAAGAAGLPVFAGTPERGIGIAYMMGPTGGYLMGFVLATALVGALADRGWDRRLFGAGLALTLGLTVIVAAGGAWLAALIGPAEALAVGVVPFLPAEVVKVCLGMCLLPALWALVERRREQPGAFPIRRGRT